jgi:cytochrome c-type biogenesis protein
MDFLLLFASFVAGVLTIAAPCILPLLPIIVGGSIVSDQDTKYRLSKVVRAGIIAASLGVSVFIFSLLLKASTVFIGVSPLFWQLVSGAILILIGVWYIMPRLYGQLLTKLRIQSRSQNVLGRSMQQRGILRNVSTGAALGPVFASCSPTYLLIIAVVLPASFILGVIYLFFYSIGLAAALFVVSLLSQKLLQRFASVASNDGVRVFFGVVFIIVGFFIIFGFDKSLQSYILEKGWYSPVSNLEESLRQPTR